MGTSERLTNHSLAVALVGYMFLLPPFIHYSKKSGEIMKKYPVEYPVTRDTMWDYNQQDRDDFDYYSRMAGIFGVAGVAVSLPAMFMGLCNARKRREEESD